ncbi:vesicle-associated membrane protein-associated protein B [Venturia canescens]|uniref:vesicle-associated membrane protein-associated protein B n=1 Tax=Venturia canescens TaxID=32260 RepID=UPI001C9CE9F5|nr:vesicle-associated membrane protein-associated protein B [Venturia canescens]
MAKPEQVLVIEPQNELRFRGPFTGAPVTSFINLTNPSINRVYFKIKTTAPKRYCVRPNSGVLKPKQSTQIAVCLQPYEFDPAEKNKHKFMVQTVIAPEGDDSDNFNNVWKDTNPSEMMEHKLKCIFENPVSSNTTAKLTAAPTPAKTDPGTNGKNKATGDSSKTAFKGTDDTEEKLKKAAQEVYQLRVEDSQLRQEYLQLKEEMLKWRTAAIDKGVNMSSSTRLTSPNPTDRSGTRVLPMTSTSVVLAVVMVVVGYLLGKLI